jgi:hypothetical protein
VYFKKNVLSAEPCFVTTGFLCIVIPVLHESSLCNLLGAAIPHLAGCNCSRLGHSLSTVSPDTHDGDVHPNTTGNKEAACSAPRCGQNADNCSIA